MFETLLVPVDGSPHSDRAVRMAGELAKCHNSSVVLLHAIKDLTLPKEITDMIYSGEITASRAQILQDSADLILDKARKQLEGAGLANVETVCEWGDPVSVILDYARDHGVALIVLGHRGLGPHGGLLGSVARKLVNMTDISCLVVT
jgi:nucleotide-binding universal stress UspA family protein